VIVNLRSQSLKVSTVSILVITHHKYGTLVFKFAPGGLDDSSFLPVEAGIFASRNRSY
jgi:hypothetical protein